MVDVLCFYNVFIDTGSGYGYSGDGGRALDAQLRAFELVAFGSDVYFCDVNLHTVRILTPCLTCLFGDSI